MSLFANVNNPQVLGGGFTQDYTLHRGDNPEAHDVHTVSCEVLAHVDVDHQLDNTVDPTSRLKLGDMRSEVRIGTKEYVCRTVWHRNAGGFIRSNHERKSEDVVMMRVNIDETTGQAIAYTGRVDTPRKAIQQVSFILDQEAQLSIERGDKNPKGLSLTPNEDGTYTFTYAVNNLQKPAELQAPTGHSERDSISDEDDVLKAISKKTVEFNHPTLGRIQVRPRPIHTAHNVSKAGEQMDGILSDKHAGRALMDQVNDAGYNDLLALGQEVLEAGRKDPRNRHPNYKRIHGCVQKLKNRDSLSVRERFIYTDMLERLLNLPVVTHCKSSVDRTGVALALAGATHHFVHHMEEEGIIKTDAGKVENQIDSSEYRNAFLTHLCRAHQQTAPARNQLGPDGNIAIDNHGKEINKKLNFKMLGTLAADSLPKDMVKHSKWTTSASHRRAVSIVATIAYILFYPVVVGFMLTIGHLFIGLAQTIFMIKGKKGAARRLTFAHELPYTLCPWKMQNIVIPRINKKHELMVKYGFFKT